MKLKLLPSHTRPREKLLSHGRHSLSDAELLALFLRTGIPGKTAIELANELLAKFGGLRPVLLAQQKSFCEIKGIGITHFIQLQAALEISKRHMKESLMQGKTLSDPKHVIEFLRQELRDQTNECFVSLFLNSQNQLLALDTLFVGSIDQATIYPREIVRRCLDYNAAAVIFGHNHPSGDAMASAEDIRLTDRLKSLLLELDIRVLDHIIIGDSDYFSFAEMKKL
ncbi:MAG: DNA repair protein RadC [Gammaproteobacteria bacterium]|nr:DNA repair protein RadC [Gammaproteobacteria bacterium]